MVSSTRRKRPTGVTILAVLYVLQGLFWLGMIPTISYVVNQVDVSTPVEVTGICWGVSAIMMLIYFGIAYGLLKGSGWARTLAIIFAIIGLLNFPIGTIVSIIILIYLFKDDVKAYFR
ncbi:MAG: hypothetical protein ACLFVB_06135 [Thermoplasmata archaeon]